jgi:hypothetical protein
MSLLAATPLASAKIVCWKNRDGVRECGNAVPPEYAQQSVERKSKMGLTVEKTTRAKTEEELAADRIDRERRAREERERRRIAAEKQRRDLVLLQTFTTEEDLRLARDGKVAALDSRIKHGRQLVLKLEENRSDMQGEAASLERGGKKVPDDLQRKISDLQQQIDKTQAEIGQREAEKVTVQAQFESDLARYRELKGG